jgi:hypothetical protein
MIEKDFMKTAHVQTGRIEQNDFDWFIAAYPDLDSAARLCGDYCITADEFAALTKEIQIRKEQKFTRRLRGVARPTPKTQPAGPAQRQVEPLDNRKRTDRSLWKRLVSAIKSHLDQPPSSKPPHGGLAYE